MAPVTTVPPTDLGENGCPLFIAYLVLGPISQARYPGDQWVGVGKKEVPGLTIGAGRWSRRLP